MSLEKIVVRRRDRTFWEPSCPDGYTEADGFADLVRAAMGKPTGFYFRRIELVPLLSWCGWTIGHRWKRTGEAWPLKAKVGDIPEADKFDVLVERDARERWQEAA